MFLTGWLMVVQAFVTLALILSFSSQIIIACELIRLPLEFVLLYEWLLSGIAFICNALACKFLGSIECILKVHSVFRKSFKFSLRERR